jgi:hypothetical protein
MFNAAFHGCALTHLQGSPVIMAHHYRGDENGFGLLTAQGELNRVGVFYQNLNKVMTCQKRLSVLNTPFQEAFTVLAGRSEDFTKSVILICDARLGDNPYKLDLVNFPRDKHLTIRVFRLQTEGMMKMIEEKVVKSSETITFSSTIPAPSLDRIEITLSP